MAKRKRKSVKKRIGNVRRHTGFFKPGESKTLEQFLVASMIQGAFTAAGAVIGTILARYLLKEVEKTIPLPAALYGAIRKETTETE